MPRWAWSESLVSYSGIRKLASSNGALFQDYALWKDSYPPSLVLVFGLAGIQAQSRWLEGWLTTPRISTPADIEVKCLSIF